MKAMIRSELSIVELAALSVEWLVGRLRGWLELARYLTVHQPDQPDPLPGQHSPFVEEETCTKFYKCTEPSPVFPVLVPCDSNDHISSSVFSGQLAK